MMATDVGGREILAVQWKGKAEGHLSVPENEGIVEGVYFLLG